MFSYIKILTRYILRLKAKTKKAKNFESSILRGERKINL